MTENMSIEQAAAVAKRASKTSLRMNAFLFEVRWGSRLCRCANTEVKERIERSLSVAM
ncbi:hypothetical protein PCAR4_840007 [Paraburkholderia caribensis]|nr:hypothetical protein PCAR4_840007 [Paraburkholderia caribensis]